MKSTLAQYKLLTPKDINPNMQLEYYVLFQDDDLHYVFESIIKPQIKNVFKELGLMKDKSDFFPQKTFRRC